MNPDEHESPTWDRPGRLPLTLEWVGGEDGHLRLLDQTLLPARVAMCDCRTAEDVRAAIRRLSVRGAPAIGVAAAYGLCLGTRAYRNLEPEAFTARVREVAEYLGGARPTAVNLHHALLHVTEAARSACQAGADAASAWAAMLDAARALAREDVETCLKIGQAGAGLVPDGGGIITHCNAGALATVGQGTALSVLYEAWRQGKRFRVFADETRPLLQGARLTAYELQAAGLDVTVLCDNAAGSLMQSGRIQMAIVGADRIAANGDTANKIGTYPLAVLARRHGIPFYVAAPTGTFDLTLRDGTEIPIEQRDESEVRRGPAGDSVPPGVPCYNPAFDVTPAELITAIVTERGLVQPVNDERVAAVCAG